MLFGSQFSNLHVYTPLIQPPNRIRDVALPLFSPPNLYAFILSKRLPDPPLASPTGCKTIQGPHTPTSL